MRSTLSELSDGRGIICSVRWWRVVAGLVMLAAVAGQVRVWANDRGFWHDELYVAFNLQHKDFVRLAGGLYWNQTAPPGWLMLEKALYELFGGAEHLLRLPALLASIGVLALTLLVARRAIGPWAALLATAMVGISPMTLYYAGELKPA